MYSNMTALGFLMVPVTDRFLYGGPIFNQRPSLNAKCQIHNVGYYIVTVIAAVQCYNNWYFIRKFTILQFYFCSKTLLFSVYIAMLKFNPDHWLP